MRKHTKRRGVRALGAVTASCMLLSGAFAMAADSDITGHWAEETLQEFIDKGYMVGCGDDTYKPDQDVIRAEFATFINKVMEYTEQSSEISRYTDVSIGDWYYPHLATALQAGYMCGTSDTTMEPKTNLTREQGFTMIAHVLGLEDGTREDLKDFDDAQQVSDWAVPFVGALVREGIVSGRTSGEDSPVLAPQKTMTRAEAVVLLDQCLDQKEEDETVYVSMNVPYADFYSAELEGNDDAVDVVSSATNSKSIRNGEGELVAGTYNDYNAEAWEAGTQTVVNIKGVTYPVAVKQSDLAKLEAMGITDEQADYYYTALDTTPSAYKTLNFDGDNMMFGEAQGETTALSEASTSFSTTTAWGDYLLNIDGADFSEQTVYGVVLTAIKDGETSEYGLRQEENIWRQTQLAWSSGVKTVEPHGNVLNYEHYVDLMGSTITGITYYTNQGTYTIGCETYVPYKFTTDNFKADSTAATAGETTVDTTDFPEDYQKTYAVTNSAGETVDTFSCDGSSLTWSGTPAVGSYTLTISDESGKYASASTSFELQTDAVVAAYDAENVKLVAAEGVSAEDFAHYLSNVSSVKVGETSYAASGRGAVAIIKEDGTIDLTATSRDTAIFEAGQTYAMEVTASGYTTNLAFELTVPNETEEPSETIYTGTATTNPDEYNDFDAYDITMDVTVKDGVIQTVALNSGSTISADNQTYFTRALDGRGTQTGVAAQLTGQNVSDIASIQCDAVSGATCSSNAIYEAVVNALTE